MLAGRAGGGAAALLLLLVVVLLTDGPEGDRGVDGPPDGGRTREAGAELRAEVLRVVDGDTVEVSIEGGGPEDVRYIGVDTPESVKPDTPVECFAKEAAARNRELVESERVRLELGAEPRDRFGRLLAYVFVGDTLINAALVEDGYARTLEIPPNTERAERFERLQREAARENVGLWGAC